MENKEVNTQGTQPPKLTKKNWIVFIVCMLIAVLAIASLVGEGMVFLVYGKYFYTTRYEKTAEEAYLKEKENDPRYDEEEEGIRTIATIHIDEYNAIYIALLGEKIGEETLLITQMAVKDGKYAYIGKEEWYSLDDATAEKIYLDASEYRMINRKGRFTDNIICSIIFDESALLELDEKYTVCQCSSDFGDNGLWLAYYRTT